MSKETNTKNARQRGTRMSKNQQEVYVRFLEDNPHFMSGMNTPSYDLHHREQDFDKLVEALNSTVGAIKDRKQWQDTFSDWRSKLLKRYRFHFSEQARKSMTDQQIRSLKRFDDFDVRALKALGKWGNESCLISKPRKFRAKRAKTESEEDNDEDVESFEFTNDTNDEFSGDPIKTENDYDVEPTVIHEIGPVIENCISIAHDTLSMPPSINSRKRKDADQDALEENTKALKKHTAAIMGLSDSINALTSTIRSYMYNK